MPLISLQGVDFSVGGPLLLDHVDLAIEPGERIALIGRNGAGKSTLLKLLSGELRADDGEVRVEGGRRIARLEQEVPQDAVGSVFDVLTDPRHNHRVEVVRGVMALEAGERLRAFFRRKRNEEKERRNGG